MKDFKRVLCLGSLFIMLFVIWTLVIVKVDVQVIGPNHTSVGLATLNGWFHGLTGVNMSLYIITDWLGLVPIFVCMGFGVLGCIQLIKRRSLIKVDRDIIVLGIYYVVVIGCYLLFEMFPINYRPLLIEGRLEASYPSSTTLLVACVMPTLMEQFSRRLNSSNLKLITNILTITFMIFMIVGRLISGVHWFTDIVGASILSVGLFCMYKAWVLLCEK